MSTIFGDPAMLNMHENLEFPPEDPFAGKFRVRGFPTNPLGKVSQLKEHLALFHAFATLRSTVETLEPESLNIALKRMPTDEELRLTWFVG